MASNGWSAVLKLVFDQPEGRPLNILCLGAHSDDLEIGCGGTILELIRRYPDLHLTWIVFSGQGPRAEEALASANDFLAAAQHKTIILKEFRDSYFPYTGAEIKEYFNQLKSGPVPDLIFTHYRHDLHQDHRLICELTWNTFRDHMILEYEIPKYDGDMGAPNFFIPLDAEICQKKIDLLLKHFQTQSNRHWFSEDTFFALLRLRGMEAPNPGKYAEAFYCRKINL
jgi:LmbE family N-acetylglucosaminyl deacetylase